MAEKILNTRILLKIDTLENWNSSTLPLKKGELAIATVAASAGSGLTEPVVMIKVGEDGVKTFKDLDWNIYAKASDVLAACKTEAGLTAFVKNVIADSGIATNSAMEALAGRLTTAEGEIDTLQADLNTAETGLKAKVAANEAAIEAIEGKFGADTVALEISAAINALNLADNYAAKVHGHEIADVNGLSDAIATAKKAGTDANSALEAYKTTNDAAVKVVSDAVAGIKNGETLDNFKEVEEALAGKQAAGNYSLEGHKHEIADVNGLESAIADAKKAGTDAATAAANALTDAKAYTDSEMTRLVGETPVAEQISGAIAAQDLANKYDAKGAAAAAQAAAEGHADGLNTAMNARVEALEAIDHDHANKTVLDGITAEKVAAWDAAEGNAKGYADGLDEAMDERVAALEAKFGDGEGNVEAQIAAAVAAEAQLRENADKALQDQIGVASAEGVEATGLNARIEELEGLVGDAKVSDAIAAAVKVEKERAEGIEGGLESRLAAVEGDYLKAADKKALQDQIDANESAIELLTNGVSADEVDGVNDLIQYVKDHGTEVTGMKNDIQANADGIEALEGRMSDAEDAIGTKAAQADLEDLAGRVSTVEGDLNAETSGLKAKMAAAEADIDALETKVGDKTVAAQIEAAIEALKIGDYAKAADLTAAINQHNTDKAALEGAIALKANDADLAAIAKTGSTDDLVQGEMVLVFDCGTSAV